MNTPEKSQQWSVTNIRCPSDPSSLESEKKSYSESYISSACCSEPRTDGEFIARTTAELHCFHNKSMSSCIVGNITEMFFCFMCKSVVSASQHPGDSRVKASFAQTKDTDLPLNWPQCTCHLFTFPIWTKKNIQLHVCYQEFIKTCTVHY